MPRVNSRNIAEYNIKNVPAEEIAEIQDSVIQNISGDTLGKMSPAQVKALDKRVTLLDVTALSHITDKQASELGLDQIRRLGDRISRLSSQALRGLTAEQVAAITTDQIQTLGERVGELDSRALEGLTEKQVKALTPRQFKPLLNSDVLKHTTPRVHHVFYQCLEKRYLPSILPEDMGGAPDEVIESVTPDLLEEMQHPEDGDDRVAAFWGRVGIDPEEVRFFTKGDIEKLSSLQLTVLSKLGLGDTIDDTKAKFWFDYRSAIAKKRKDSSIKRTEDEYWMEAMTPDLYKRMEELQGGTQPFWKRVGIDPLKIKSLTKRDIQKLSLAQLRVLQKLDLEKTLTNAPAKLEFMHRLAVLDNIEKAKEGRARKVYLFQKMSATVEIGGIESLGRKLRKNETWLTVQKIFWGFLMTITFVSVLHDLGLFAIRKLRGDE